MSPLLPARIAVKNPAKLQKIKNAIRNLYSGIPQRSVDANVLLIKELCKQSSIAEVQEVLRQLIARLIRECNSLCESISKYSTQALGKVIGELVKFKDLEGLRFLARAHKSKRVCRKALKELVKFKDLRGIRAVAQWGKHKEIRYIAIAQLVKLRDLEGLRYVAQWNMYEDTVNYAVRELYKLVDLLVHARDREGLKVLVLLAPNAEAQRRAISALERLLKDAIQIKDIESLKLIAAYGMNRQSRLEAVNHLEDIKSLEFVIERMRDKCSQTTTAAVTKLSEFLNELIRGKDRVGLEYVAEYSKDSKTWRKAIEELQRIREISQEERMVDALHRVFSISERTIGKGKV